MTKPKRVALYLRVSTKADQTVENQREALEKAAQYHGWEIVETYKDEGISGAKGREKRPAFDNLCKALARKEFDMIAAFSLDRLSRSLAHLVDFLGEVEGKGVNLYLHNQAIDTSTPAGRALFQMLGVFAEFERAMIRERVNAGLARAKKTGKNRLGNKLYLGRPGGMTKAKAAEARALLAKGIGILKVAKQLGVGTSTIQKVKDGEHVVLREIAA